MEGLTDGVALGFTVVFATSDGVNEGKEESGTILDGCMLGTSVFVGVVEGSVLV